MWETKAEGEICGGRVEKRRKNKYQDPGRCEVRGVRWKRLNP